MRKMQDKFRLNMDILAIAEEVLFSNDIRSTIREHTTNVKSEVRRHNIKKFSDMIASQCTKSKIKIV